MKFKVYKFDEVENIKELSNEKIGLFYIILVYFLIIIIGVAITWGYFGKIDLRVKSEGILEMRAESSLVVNLNVGKIKNSKLIEGKNVEKGEVLYEIENESLVNEKNYILKEIEEKQNLYNAMVGKKYKNNIATTNYLNEIENEKIELSTLDVEIGEQEYTVYANSELYKVGGVARVEYEKSENALNILKEKRKQRAREFEINRNNKKIELKNEIKELEMKLKTVNESIKNSKITAPISGSLEKLVPINEGDTLTSETSIVKIIPNSDKYKINIYISENDIVKIKIGNIINYHLNYPDEKKNIDLSGKVESISKNVITRENGGRYYLVVGTINEKDIKELKLKNGMTLESNIIYGRKRILDYILEIMNFKLKTL